MTEQTEGTPLIDPETVKSVVKATAVEVTAVSDQTKRKPTASELAPGHYCWGTGRRKSAVARVRIRPGDGKMMINNRSVEDYFPGLQDRNVVGEPLKVSDSVGKYDVFVKVAGGGSTGQSGAVMLGLARALVVADPDLFSSLRDAGYLTRDSRMVERKKYGQKGARKKFQFSKR